MRSPCKPENLLPGRGIGLCAVLFIHREDRDTAEASRCFSEAAWPDSLQTLTVDISQDQEVARWFGVQDTPALAFITDGALLYIEYGFKPSACRELLSLAQRQQRRLASVDGRRSNAKGQVGT